jgi:hypothetical protein
LTPSPTERATIRLGYLYGWLNLIRQDDGVLTPSPSGEGYNNDNNQKLKHSL